jgi:hypothetical protein
MVKIDRFSAILILSESSEKTGRGGILAGVAHRPSHRKEMFAKIIALFPVVSRRLGNG